jgi:hypothetical protein
MSESIGSNASSVLVLFQKNVSLPTAHTVHILSGKLYTLRTSLVARKYN